MSGKILLTLQRFQATESLIMKRKHFRFLVREHIKLLTTEQFRQLCFTALHEDHWPLFHEWNKAEQTLPGLTKKVEIKYWKYLAASHRKTLTVRMTELGDQGYTSVVLEWLILNHHWDTSLITTARGK